VLLSLSWYPPVCRDAAFVVSARATGNTAIRQSSNAQTISPVTIADFDDPTGFVGGSLTATVFAVPKCYHQ